MSSENSVEVAIGTSEVVSVTESSSVTSSSTSETSSSTLVERASNEESLAALSIVTTEVKESSSSSSEVKSLTQTFNDVLSTSNEVIPPAVSQPKGLEEILQPPPTSSQEQGNEKIEISQESKSITTSSTSVSESVNIVSSSVESQGISEQQQPPVQAEPIAEVPQKIEEPSAPQVVQESSVPPSADNIVSAPGSEIQQENIKNALKEIISEIDKVVDSEAEFAPTYTDNSLAIENKENLLSELIVNGATPSSQGLLTDAVPKSWCPTTNGSSATTNLSSTWPISSQTPTPSSFDCSSSPYFLNRPSNLGPSSIDRTLTPSCSQLASASSPPPCSSFSASETTATSTSTSIWNQTKEHTVMTVRDDSIDNVEFT